MTPNEYRNHPSLALRRAFFRGRYARKADQDLDTNPYREVRTTVKSRRGSWSEAFSTAWAVGWRDADRGQVPAAAAATVGDDEGERI